MFHPIYYASKTFNVAQKNYTISELEWLVVVYAFETFWANLLEQGVGTYQPCYSSLFYS